MTKRMNIRQSNISIHTSHTGCDPSIGIDWYAKAIFQSTHPIRDATEWLDENDLKLFISIHTSHTGCDAPFLVNVGNTVISIHTSHTGCDGSPIEGRPVTKNFNPHIPYGMRLCSAQRICFSDPISIHTSHTGCDPSWLMQIWKKGDFNPHIPYGMRRIPRICSGRSRDFNPHIPYGMRPSTKTS